MTVLTTPTATLRFFQERLIIGEFELLEIPLAVQDLIGLAAVYHADPTADDQLPPFIRMPEMDTWLIIWSHPGGPTHSMICPPHLQIVDYGFDPRRDFLCLALQPTTLASWGVTPFGPEVHIPQAFPLFDAALRRCDRRDLPWEERARSLLLETCHLPRVATQGSSECLQALNHLHTQGPACRITDLADAVHIHQRQLNRFFTTITGWPLKDWRRGERMARSIIEWWHGRDLSHPQDVGWSDSSHIYRECRLLFGCGQRRIRQALSRHRLWAQAWHLPAAALHEDVDG